MRPFLRGFADELIKVSQPPMGGTIGGVRMNPQTATGGERAPKPTYGTAPGTDLSGAIGVQRMESPGGAKAAPWRPSPGYKPNPASDPKPAPMMPKPGGGVQRPSNATPAWENSGGMHSRENNEAAYNQGRAGGPMPSSLQNAPGMGAAPRALSSTEKSFVMGQRAPGGGGGAPGSMQMKPGQASAFRPPATPASAAAGASTAANQMASGISGSVGTVGRAAKKLVPGAMAASGVGGGLAGMVPGGS